MFGPLFIGPFISNLSAYIGYTIIFTISFILFISAVVSSFFLKRRQAEGEFYFRKVLNERKYNKNWARVLYAHLFQGLREGMFLFVITVWVFLITNSEFALGMFNLFLSGLSFVFYFVATKFITPPLRKKAIFIGGLMIYFLIYIILFILTYIYVFFFLVIIGVDRKSVV